MSRACETIAGPLYSRRLQIYPCKLEQTKRRGEALERVVTGLLIVGTRRLRARSFRRIFKRVKQRRAAFRKLESEDLRDLAVAQLPRLRSTDFGCSATAESFALICELARRTLQLEISKPQLIAAWTALKGAVAELEIGHGKTTALVVSACVAALAGHRVHFYSIDEAAAKRILDTFQPLYGALGLSAGFVCRDMDPPARREVYAAHIVHGTPGQIATDYMRDRRHLGAKIGSLRLQVARLCGGNQFAEELSLQGLQFALVDDADYLLTDEAARTVGLLGKSNLIDEEQMAREVVTFAKKLKADKDFDILHELRDIYLTELGKGRTEQLSGELRGLWSAENRRGAAMRHALQALHLFCRDEHYQVHDHDVIAMDSATAQALDDRSWVPSLRHLLVAKEGCGLDEDDRVVSRTTCRQVFKDYLKVGGVMNPAPELAGELWNNYRLACIPVTWDGKRSRLRTSEVIHPTVAEQLVAIVERTKRLLVENKAILITTRSDDATRQLSQLLTVAGLAHSILDSEQMPPTATSGRSTIIPGKVLILQNVLSKDSRLKLDRSQPADCNLHIIMAERQDSARLERQLLSYIANYGARGHVEAILSWEDPLLEPLRSSPLFGLARNIASLVPSLSGRIGAVAMHQAQRKRERLLTNIRQKLMTRDGSVRRALAFSERID